MTKPTISNRQLESIRIVIVDDHPLVREGVTALIEREPGMAVVGEADGTTAALEVIGKKAPHLAVVDISLRDGNGIDLIKQIKQKHEGVRVLVSSMHDEIVYAERALQAGALGYVHKQEGSQRLIEAIRRVIEGRVFVSEQVNDRLLARAASQPADQRGKSPVDTLSNRELEVFELIGEGIAKQQIADRLHVSVKTVDTHRHNIKIKLDLPDATAVAHFATQWVLSEK